MSYRFRPMSRVGVVCVMAAIALLHTGQAAPDTSPAPGATLDSIDKAIRRGVDFLVADQNPNGSWGAATRTKGLNIFAPVPGAHDAFRAGTTGLALSGLIDTGDARAEVNTAIMKAGTWAASELPKLRRVDKNTTYNCWGHAYGLRALTRLYQREADPARKNEWRRLAQEQIDFANRYEEINGGWGYLDFDGLTTQKPSGVPTSFTTATVLLAMAEARNVTGATLDPQVVKRSTDSIKIQRTPDFSYTYAFSHRMRPRSGINRPAGSLGRSQNCNACLRVFGDTTVTDDIIRTWADRFLAREGFLSNGRKRPVPHEAPFQIAGYFYYYGVYYFTESVRLLPRSEHAAYARRLAAIVLQHQETDGSWWDYPLYSYHQPYGTGYALMTLAWCRDVISGAD